MALNKINDFFGAVRIDAEKIKTKTTHRVEFRCPLTIKRRINLSEITTQLKRTKHRI